MNRKELYDISEVCTMLNTTSRTLRFYEEKGLISSIKSYSNRRQYNLIQIELIKKILVLRTLGLSVSRIKDIQDGDSDLRQAIIERKAEIIAKLVARSKEIQLLDEALHTIDEGGDIFSEDDIDNESSEQFNEIVASATKNFINGDLKMLFENFSELLQIYTPLSALERIIADALIPLGGFITIDRIENDRFNSRIFYSYLRYEKLGLRIKFVLFNDKIHGFWLNYYEI